MFSAIRTPGVWLWLIRHGPFALIPVLLSQRVKQIPKALAGLGILIVLGMWLERYVLVVPSVWHDASLPLGILELCILAGFFGGYALAFLTFVQVFVPADSTEMS